MYKFINYVPNNFKNISRCNNNKHTRTREKITHAHVICCILQQCSKTEISVKCI